MDTGVQELLRTVGVLFGGTIAGAWGVGRFTQWVLDRRNGQGDKGFRDKLLANQVEMITILRGVDNKLGRVDNKLGLVGNGVQETVKKLDAIALVQAGQVGFDRGRKE